MLKKRVFCWNRWPFCTGSNVTQPRLEMQASDRNNRLTFDSIYDFINDFRAFLEVYVSYNTLRHLTMGTANSGRT